MSSGATESCCIGSGVNILKISLQFGDKTGLHKAYTIEYFHGKALYRDWGGRMIDPFETGIDKSHRKAFGDRQVIQDRQTPSPWKFEEFEEFEV